MGADPRSHIGWPSRLGNPCGRVGLPSGTLVEGVHLAFHLRLSLMDTSQGFSRGNTRAQLMNLVSLRSLLAAWEAS
jgi:hypothetical protein